MARTDADCQRAARLFGKDRTVACIAEAYVRFDA